MTARKFLPGCKPAAAVIWFALHGCGTMAEAADTITVDLINATGRRVTEAVAMTACTPADADCQIAASIAQIGQPAGPCFGPQVARRSARS